MKSGLNQSLAWPRFAGQEVYYMPINVTKEPFTDIRVRQAAALAINQKEILENVFANYGAVANNFLISALPESKIEPASSAMIRTRPTPCWTRQRAGSWAPTACGPRMASGCRSRSGRKATACSAA
ncbi:MAG: hypothetical protein IPF96_02135 [Rhodobacter sp.]|nr:hypothetical protein [Rhodobacter sp.]